MFYCYNILNHLASIATTVYLVYFNALIISEEAMHCEDKNCEILKYADKKICSIVEYEHVADLFCSMALKCLEEPPLQARGVAKVDSEVEKSANASIYLPDQVIDGNNSK